MTLTLEKIIHKLLNIIKYFFIFIFLLVVILFITIFLDKNIADSITKKKILTLELGMTKEQVRELLGEPLEIIHYSKEQIGKDNDIYLYATSKFIGEGLEINISISDGVLDGIGLEFYDNYFYKCYKNDENSCPKIISPFLWKYLIPDD